MASWEICVSGKNVLITDEHLESKQNRFDLLPRFGPQEIWLWLPQLFIWKWDTLKFQVFYYHFVHEHMTHHQFDQESPITTQFMKIPMLSLWFRWFRPVVGYTAHPSYIHIYIYISPWLMVVDPTSIPLMLLFTTSAFPTGLLGILHCCHQCHHNHQFINTMTVDISIISGYFPMLMLAVCTWYSGFIHYTFNCHAGIKYKPYPLVN